MRYIFCDIDGTISDSRHRMHYIRGKKKRFDLFHSESQNDKVVHSVNHMMRNFCKFSDVQPVFLTGRPEEYRFSTKIWLETNVDVCKKGDYMLFMRTSGDYSGNHMLKEQYLNHVGTKNVILAIDDQKESIDMYHRNYIPALWV